MTQKFNSQSPATGTSPHYVAGSLSEAQEKAVKHKGGPILVAAGAGSGKTFTLTNRLAHILKNGADPSQIIAITFTNKAADEMLNRIKKMNVVPREGSLFIGTFHSLGARILKEEAAFWGRTAGFTIFDDEDSLSLIKGIIKAMNVAKDKYNAAGIVHAISKMKNELVERAGIDPKTPYEQTVMMMYDRYEEALKKNNAFDFDDLIEKVVRLCQSSAPALNKYQTRWQHILIDEFQDVNTSQYAMVKLFAEKHQNLFVIGDDAQSIYSFRGSDFRNFLNFEDDWDNATTVKLEENYRSTKNIIHASNEVIKNNIQQKPKNLWTNNPQGSPIFVTAYPDGEGEADGVADRIMALVRKGEQLEHIVILYRTNAQSRAIEQALLQSQIPYEIFGGLKFYERKEIKDIISAIRLAVNPNDELSRERLVKNFNKGIGAALVEKLPELAPSLSLVEMINFFIAHTGYNDFLQKKFKNAQDRMDNIRELVNFAASFKDAKSFLERVALMASTDGRPKMQSRSVKLMTMHMAKGLEFKHAFLVGINETLIPHERSLGRTEDIEEERRLMYVGMTRAKEHLYISFFALPSRFLSEIPPELVEFKKVFNRRERYSEWNEESIYLD